jgi:SAM-dependent methyltransferase
MTPAEEAAGEARFTRERHEADRRYNEALTALDRAVVAAGAQPAVGRDDLLALASTLLVFLQQITAFVETKDREVSAAAGARIAELERGLEPIAELRAQMTIARRAIEAISRQSSVASRQSQSSVVGPPPPSAAHPALGTEHPAPSTQHPAGTEHPAPSTQHLAPYNQHPAPYKYVAFEDAFRGSDAAIADKLRGYVPLFAGAAGVVDLGCGRGELLAALRDAGIRARGVDANAEMAATARARGLDATHGDALAFLEAAPDESLGGVVATQVVEHLQPDYLMRLLDVASHKLRPGAPIVLETINPACWLAFFSSYIRDLTHVKPVHPETLQYLLRASGFERVEIRYSAPVPDHMKMKTVDLPPALVGSTDAASAALAAVAHAVNANAVILNNLLFTHFDYAAIGYRI